MVSSIRRVYCETKQHVANLIATKIVRVRSAGASCVCWAVCRFNKCVKINSICSAILKQLQFQMDKCCPKGSSCTLTISLPYTLKENLYFWYFAAKNKATHGMVMIMLNKTAASTLWSNLFSSICVSIRGKSKNCVAVFWLAAAADEWKMAAVRMTQLLLLLVTQELVRGRACLTLQHI